MKTYNVDYFIDKFSKIPDEKWGSGTLNSNGKYCVAGHCGVNSNEDYFKGSSEELRNEEASALAKIFIPVMNKYFPDNGIDNEYQILWAVNDGCKSLYKGGERYNTTPKERVLDILYKAKEMEPRETTVTREIVKYVAIDAEIREETRELEFELN